MGAPNPPFEGAPPNMFAPNKNEWASPEQMGPILKQWVDLARTPNLDAAHQKLLQQLDDILKKNGVWDDVNQNAATAKIAGLSKEDLSAALNGAKGDAGQALNTFTSSSRTQNSVSNSTRTGTNVTYLDLPTPEEFLDDFSNSYGIHLQGLVQSGAIGQDVADFAKQTEQASAIFSNYLRERIGRLLKGEPLWKTVGTDANNKLIGVRTGQQSDINQKGSDTITGSDTSSGGGGGGSVSGSAGPISASNPEGSPPGGGGTDSSSTYNLQYNSDQTDKTREDEALVARNKLAYVANLAPLDYLKDAASAQSLNLLYEGQKGTAARERQTAEGGESFATRRL